MIAGVLAALAALAALGGSSLARRALALGAAALAVLLFMHSLRRAGEKAGRAKDQLDRPGSSMTS